MGTHDLHGYTQKAEYRALIWGSILMAVTGLVLIFPDSFTQIAPAWLVRVAETVHYYEGILAVSAIIIRHFFFVIFLPEEYPMSWTWITGRMSLSHWKSNHPREADLKQVLNQMFQILGVRFMRWLLVPAALFLLFSIYIFASPAQEGKFEYNVFDPPKKCKMCHREIFKEWEQSLMAQAFTHPWDEVEYFRLALPHALKEEKVAGVKAGCIGCHAPLAFLCGDIPPKPVAEKTRANEGVSCDICHCIIGSTEKEPFNFSYIIEPGNTKYGQRKEVKKSSFHKTAYSDFISTPELCACCHDEQSPYGAWVKSTYREWKAGPYAAQGVRCHDCHMHYAPGKSTGLGMEHEDVSHHSFHGAHFPGKLAGAVDLALYPMSNRAEPDRTLAFTVNLFNGKVGHMIPSGSSEERMLWLEVRATDAEGNVYDIPVEEKGFEGEQYTIADPTAVAYQAMGEIMEKDGYSGLSRDGDVQPGCRIFRKPFFDPKGRMTVCQWYTAQNEKIDYRIGPRRTLIEQYKWKVPKDAAKGPVTLTASLYFSEVPSSVGRFLNLPEGEYAPILVNRVSVEVPVE